MRAWIVHLIKPLPLYAAHWPSGYFPRKFYYQRDAKALAIEVKRRGGEAKIERETR